MCAYMSRVTREWSSSETVDWVSGLGHSTSRRHGAGPNYLVSDLGQFDFDHGRMRLTHLHPGVDRGKVFEKTGFALDAVEPLPPTPPPSDEELRLLREVIDPLGVRDLELMSGARRREALRAILAREMDAAA